MSAQTDIEKWMVSVKRGIVSEHELYSHFVLAGERHPLRDIWAAIPNEYKEAFKTWIEINAVNPELVFITNNATVQPAVLMKAYSDFFHGKTEGDKPIAGTVWNVRGIR